MADYIVELCHHKAVQPMPRHYYLRPQGAGLIDNVTHLCGCLLPAPGRAHTTIDQGLSDHAKRSPGTPLPLEMDRMEAAKCPAFAFPVAYPFARGLASFGLPSLTLRSLAALRASRVQALTRLRFFSAWNPYVQISLYHVPLIRTRAPSRASRWT
jgi:hypothetical protein